MRFHLILVLVSCFSLVFSQDYDALIKAEGKAYYSKQNASHKRVGQNYDVVYHNLKLTIDPAVRLISGSVVTQLVTQEDNFSLFSFDLDDRMIVDSVIFENNSLSFNHTSDEVQITIPALPKNTSIVVEVFYSGNPSLNEQRGFSYDNQKDGPIAWTLSQPYGAYGWWPCKQQLEDKIDSLDMEITTPKGNKAAGLGLLQRVDTLADSSLVFHWKHRYPVVTYLVAVAVTNYYEESHYVMLSNGDSVLHLDYLYPAYKPQADVLRKEIDGQMFLFDSLFGAYPFKNEKYGHAQFGRGGGMEHQTMSFMSDLNFDLMAHELAHQWFGNKITCGSWQDLWLNEGFATYLNGLAREFLREEQEWYEFLEVSIDKVTSQPNGPVFAYDTTDVGILFDGNLRYRKGAMVLHMLRWEIGDDAFFKGMRDYALDANLCYDFAKTGDFQSYMEDAGGVDLTDFFNRWVYQEGFPKITTRWKRTAGNGIELKLAQTTSHPTVSFFPLKIELELSGEGKDTVITVNHWNMNDSYILSVGFKVESITFDPHHWLVAKNTLVEEDHVDVARITAYPNPAGNEISVFVKDKKIDTIEIVDIQGKVVRKLDVEELKNQIVRLSTQGLMQGLYFIKVFSGDESLVLKFVKE
ncbi:MAG: T9SS type A sorting domain-containing protein [Bacteroidia bacterium]|nr:T9SS type A sorting domain-containing protein [Bacteroidia bacterium]